MPNAYTKATTQLKCQRPTQKPQHSSLAASDTAVRLESALFHVCGVPQALTFWALVSRIGGIDLEAVKPMEGGADISQ